MKYNLNSEQLRLICVNLSDEIKRVGTCHIALYMTMGNTDHEVAMKSIRRFGDEVIPLIEKEVGPLAGVNVSKPMRAAE